MAAKRECRNAHRTSSGLPSLEGRGRAPGSEGPMPMEPPTTLCLPPGSDAPMLQVSPLPCHA